MIDLHIHSYYSDGTMSPEELVLHAKTKGAHTIAITDHDGIAGLREGEEAGRQYGVNVLPGIELSTEDEGEFYMHILGYCFNRENEELKNEVEIIRRKRVERNEKLLAALREIGYKLTNDDLQLREGQDFVGKPTIAMALMKKGYISSPKEAFKEGHYMRSDIVRKVHREKISTKSAIKLIKEAGGIPVLAHPMKIAYSAVQAEDSFFEMLERQLIKMKEWGLEGMECYYSGHLPQDTKHLVHLANKHHLIITAGSDFHGLEFDNNIKLGGFPIDENFDEKKIITEIQNRNFCYNVMSR